MPAPHRHAARLLLWLVVVCAWAVAGCGGGQKPHTPASCAHGYLTRYGCAAHPPSFGIPPKGLTLPRTASLAGTADMYDSVNLSQIPASPFAVAGYTSGFWPTYPLLHGRFPHAHTISIAVNAGHVARCLDVEPGDATPSQAAGWYDADRLAGVKRPCLYAALSNMPAVRANLAAHGIGRSSVFLWDANWTFVRHLDAGFDATQWTDHALGRNLDASVVTRAFLGINPKPRPKAAKWSSVELQVKGTLTASTVVRVKHGRWTVGRGWRARPLPYNARPLGGGS